MSDTKWRDAVEGFGLDMTAEELSQRRGRVALTSLCPTASDFTFGVSLPRSNHSWFIVRIMKTLLTLIGIDNGKMSDTDVYLLNG
jgi:hypothetical protein